MPNLTNRLEALGGSRLRAGTVALTLGALVMIPIGAYYASDHHGIGRRVDDAQRELAFRSVRLGAMLEQAISAPGSVVLLGSGQASPRLALIADEALRLNPALTQISLVPLDGTERRFLRLADDARVEAAAVTDHGHGLPLPILSVAEAPQVQLGDGVMQIRQSLIAEQRDTHKAWGHISATLDFSRAGKLMGLDDLAERGYNLRIEHQAGGHRSTLVHFGGVLRDTAAAQPIPVTAAPDLVLRVNVPAAWEVLPITLPEFFFMLTSGLLIALLTYLQLRRPALLRREIAEHTRRLASEKRVLESEIAVRLEAERLLEESHALLDSIFAHIPSMIVVREAESGRIVRVNTKGEEILGYREDELIGRRADEFLSADQARRLTSADQQAVATGSMVELPEEFIQASGAAHWVSIKVMPVVAGEGMPGYVLEIAENITERKHLDSALTENMHFVEQLLEAMPSPVFFKGIDGRYIGVNKAFENFYGVKAEEIVGKTVFDISPPELARIYDSADRALLETRGTQIYESSVSTPSGERRDVIFNKAVFSSAHGDAAGIVGVVLDISERKSAERHVLQLNRALAVLNEINQAIARIKDRRSLFDRTLHILQNVGEFWGSWIYLNGDDMPDLISSGRRADLLAKLNARVRADLGKGRATLGEYGRVLGSEPSFHTSLLDLAPTLAADEEELASLGLAHLPLRSGGKLAGGICILAASEEIEDEKVRKLLVSLADNLSFAVDALLQEQGREIAERKLQLASHVFENSAEGVMITDANNTILLVNRRFSEITGYSADEVIGKSPKLLNSGQQDASFYANMWRSLANRGEWHGEIRNRRKDGEVIVEWMTLSAVKADDGTVSNYVAVFSEITVHKKIKKRTQYLAHYDVLTSLPNRVLFADRLEQSIIGAKRNKKLAALLFVDLDRFDEINKNFGHAAGDIVLQEVASRLIASTPEGCSVSRLGSDEFAVVLSDLEAIEEASNVAEHVLQVLGRPFYLAGSETTISASLGIGVFPKDGADGEALIKASDAAMYQSVEAGGNTYRFYSPQTNDAMSDRIRLRERLHRAIERNELRVFYEPIVSGATGKIIGAEALLRWFRPETGFVSPQAFIPLLEESGLVVKIGDWVLRTALADSELWRAECNSDVMIAVNLSRAQLNDERCVERVQAALQEFGVRAETLQLEISEGSLMSDAPRGLAVLHKLKQLGLRLAIDNFGTGYSSLSYLSRFPIDCLKIDRSFILDTPNDAEAVAVTETIVAMGHALRFDVVAEGVEHAQQIEFLGRIGCDRLQGYRFSQAVSAHDFANLLRQTDGYDALLRTGEATARLQLVS